MPAQYCVEYFYAKPNQRDHLCRALSKLVPKARQEQGCLRYDLLEDAKNQDLFILLMKFDSETSMRLHEQQAFVQDFISNAMPKYCERLVCNDAVEVANLIDDTP